MEILKGTSRGKPLFYRSKKELSTCALLREAVAAKYWTIVARNKWYLRFCSTFGAGNFGELSVRTAFVLLLHTAIWAALWSGETLVSVKSLFGCSESKLSTAIATG